MFVNLQTVQPIKLEKSAKKLTAGCRMLDVGYKGAIQYRHKVVFSITFFKSRSISVIIFL